MPTPREMSSPLAAAGAIVAVLGVVALANVAASPADDEARGDRDGGAPSFAEDAGVVPESAAARALRDGRPMDLNAASADDLQLLPRIGPRIAERILEERERRAGFDSVDDLLAVRGIGPRTLDRIRAMLEVASAQDGGRPSVAQPP